MRILIAEDRAIVRQGIRALLEAEGFSVVAEAADGREAVRLAAATQPDVAVLDILMPSLNGLDAAREILRLSPRSKAVLLTAHNNPSYVREALRAGVSAFVLKDCALETLVEAIREAARGNVYLPSPVMRTMLAAPEDHFAAPLSARERQVLQLLAEGKTTKEVAGILGLSAKTADNHRTRIMLKLGLHDTPSLVRYAIREGLVEP